MSTANMPDSISPMNKKNRNVHVVQFYSEDRFLLDELSHFVGTALAAGSSAVVIATTGHEENLFHKLGSQGLHLASAIAEGRYVALDAGKTLSRFMVGDLPDVARFSEVIGEVLASAAAAAKDENHRVVAFGEMVALLWAEGKTEGAIRVEKLWNQLARTYSFSLRCAYPMQGFCREEHADSLLQICAEHSGVVPDESYSELTSEEERLRTVVRLQQRMQVLLNEVETHRRDEQFRLFVDAVPDYAIFMLDTEGHVSTWNTGAERIKGYRAPEILGKHFSCFYPSEDVLSGKPERLMRLAVEQGHAEDEGWRVRKDGSKFWAGVTIAAVRDQSGRLIAFGKVTRDLSERRRAELALRRSEDRFRLMADAVQDYAIFMLDPEGHVSTWNSGAERIQGYKAAEIIGRHFSCFYSEADIASGKPALDLEVAAKQGRCEVDSWRRRKDGSSFFANVIVTPVRDETNRLIGFAKVTRDVTERMQKEKSLRDLTSHLLQMQDEERKRIGRDLHDSLGQCVTALKINLDSLALSLGPELSDRVMQSVHLAEECVKEIRTISYLLYPPMLEEMGLKSAISWYLEGFTMRSGIRVTLEVADDFGRLSRDTELALFRVLQEGLTNVHRHSGSPTAHVQLSIKNEMAILEIADEGKGIPATVQGESGVSRQEVIGVGLRGMRERLTQLGGQLEISSNEHGATVSAMVPVKETPEVRDQLRLASS